MSLKEEARQLLAESENVSPERLNPCFVQELRSQRKLPIDPESASEYGGYYDLGGETISEKEAEADAKEMKKFLESIK